MAEISEVTEPLKKLVKGKNALVFGAVGLAAGLVVLFMKGSSSNSSGSGVLADSAASTSDQTVQALGAQIQAFETSVKSSNDSLAVQLSATNEAVEALKTSDQTFQTTTSANQVSIVDQLLTLQQTQDTLTQKVNTPIYTTPVASNGGSSGGYSVSQTNQRNDTGMVVGSNGGLSVPNMGVNHVTTQADLSNVVSTQVTQQGYGTVTVRTATGTASVLAGSVFDPTSSNYRPELN